MRAPSVWMRPFRIQLSLINSGRKRSYVSWMNTISSFLTSNEMRLRFPQSFNWENPHSKDMFHHTNNNVSVSKIKHARVSLREICRGDPPIFSARGNLLLLLTALKILDLLCPLQWRAWIPQRSRKTKWNRNFKHERNPRRSSLPEKLTVTEKNRGGINL